MHLIVPKMPHTREGQATRDAGAKPWLSASLSDPGTVRPAQGQEQRQWLA